MVKFISYKIYIYCNMDNKKLQEKFYISGNLGIGKFIQIKTKEGTLVLMLGPEGTYHTDLLEKTLINENIPVKYINPSSENLVVIPETDCYEVVSAGQHMIRGKSLIFFGKSEQYGIGPNKKNLDECIFFRDIEKEYLPF
jgi:hypothetical protein